MEENNITLVQKFGYFFNGLCIMSFVTLIYIVIANFKGWPTPLKAIELTAIEANQVDLSYAMSAAQEDILELHKKVKK